jgi:hypothetical protein
MNNFFYFLYTNVGIDMATPGMPQTFTRANIGALGFIMLAITTVIVALYYLLPRFSNFFARYVNRKSWTIFLVLTALLNALIVFLNCQSLVQQTIKRTPNMNVAATKTAVYIFSIDTFIFTLILFFLLSLILRYVSVHTRYIPF